MEQPLLAMSMALDGGPGPLGRAMAQMKEAMGTNDAAELPEPSKNVDIAIVGGGLGKPRSPCTEDE